VLAAAHRERLLATSPVVVRRRVVLGTVDLHRVAQALRRLLYPQSFGLGSGTVR
jgi:hypothetical protein